MLTIQIPRKYIAATMRFAATKDTRYILNGLYIECHANVAYLVATNGAALAVSRIVRESGATWNGQGSAIIPADALSGIKANGNNGLDIIVTSADEKGGTRFTLHDCGTETRGAVVDGKFPDWQRVIPSETSGGVSQFDCELLARCSKAAKDLGRKSGHVNIRHNGMTESQSHEGAAIVDCGDPAFLAVVMPMRGMGEDSHDWLGENAAAFGRLDMADALTEAYPESPPLAVVGAEIADAFGMRGLPNTLVVERV